MKLAQFLNMSLEPNFADLEVLGVTHDSRQVKPGFAVHAIGAGVSLIELQQNSETTYRLYDYGRPRELHLDRGIAVARGEPYDPALHRYVPPTGPAALVDGPYFRLDRIERVSEDSVRERYSGPLLVLPRLGTARVDGEPVEPGQCALASSLDALELPGHGQALIAQPCGA